MRSGVKAGQSLANSALDQLFDGAVVTARRLGGTRGRPVSR